MVRMTPSNQAASATVVVARSTGPRIGKTRDLLTGEKSTAANGYEYHYRRVGLNHDQPLVDLYKLLVALEPLYEILVPGDLIQDDAKLSYALRRSTPRAATPDTPAQPAVLQDYASRLLILDLDNVPVDLPFDFNDRDQVEKRIRSVLPPFMAEVQLLIACSASHGFSQTLCARVFAMLDRPFTLNEKKALMRDYVIGGYEKNTDPGPFPRYIDAALFRAAQQCFVGASFANGADPYAHVRFFIRSETPAPIVITDEIFDDLYEVDETDEVSRLIGVKPRRTSKLKGQHIGEIKIFGDYNKALEHLRETPDEPGTLHDAIFGTAVAAYIEDPLADQKRITREIRDAVEDRLGRVGVSVKHGRGLERWKEVEVKVKEAAERARATFRPEKAPTLTVEEAEAQIPDLLKSFFDTAERNARAFRSVKPTDVTPIKDRRVHTLQISAGVGKSHHVIKALADLSRRATSMFQPRVMVSVPDNILAEQYYEELVAEGARVMWYRGFKDLCQEAIVPLMETWLSAYGTAEGFCSTCGFKDTCKYPNQDLSKAHIVIIAGSAVFEKLPDMAKVVDENKTSKEPFMPKGTDIEQILGDFDPDLFQRNFDLVIIDEANPARWIEEHEIPIQSLNWSPSERLVDQIERNACREGRTAANVAGLVVRVREEFAAAGGLLCEDGQLAYGQDYLSGVPFVLRNISAGQWAQIRIGMWDALDSVTTEMAYKLHEGIQTPKFKAIKAEAEHVRAWHRLIDCMEPRFDGYQGYAALTEKGTVDLAWRKEVNDAFKPLPKLILDATADMDMLRQFFPEATRTDLRVKDGPGVLRTFYTVKATDRRLRDREEQQRIRDHVESFPAREKGIIATRKLIEDSRSVLVPDGVETAWYGKLRGVNSFENVGYLALVGRNFPPVDALRRLALTIFGPRAADEPDFYDEPQRVLGAFNMRDGGVAKSDRHHHKSVSIMKCLEQTVYAELEQADARGRGVRRGVDRPLIIDQFTDVAVPNLVYDVLGAEMTQRGSLADLVTKHLRNGVACNSIKGWQFVLERKTKNFRTLFRGATVGDRALVDVCREAWERVQALNEDVWVMRYENKVIGCSGIMLPTSVKYAAELVAFSEEY